MTRVLEEDLRRPVAEFLQKDGMRVMHEVPINGRIADLVGVGEVLIAVELKLTDWKTGLRQAMAYQLACERSYLCMPFHQALRVVYRAHYLEKEGIGLLGCLPETGEVRVMIPAERSRRLLPFMADAVRSSASRGHRARGTNQTSSLSLFVR
jgi:hypothetical protein